MKLITMPIVEKYKKAQLLHWTNDFAVIPPNGKHLVIVDRNNSPLTRKKTLT